MWFSCPSRGFMGTLHEFGTQQDGWRMSQTVILMSYSFLLHSSPQHSLVTPFSISESLPPFPFWGSSTLVQVSFTFSFLFFLPCASYRMVLDTFHPHAYGFISFFLFLLNTTHVLLHFNIGCI